MLRISRAVVSLSVILLMSIGASGAERKISVSKKKLIRELLRVTEAQDGTADAIIDILGGRLGMPLPAEEARGEMREDREMGAIAEETQGALYDRYFNEKQLRDLIAFFKTETGHHYVEVARKIAAETRKNLQAAATRQVTEGAEKERAAKTRDSMRAFGVALKAYIVDHGTIPTVQNIDELATALSPKYMYTVPRQDAWGRSFRYESSADGKHYTIASPGIDGKFAPDRQAYGDDIVYSDGRFIHGGDPYYHQ